MPIYIKGGAKMAEISDSRLEVIERMFYMGVVAGFAYGVYNVFAALL